MSGWIKTALLAACCLSFGAAADVPGDDSQRSLGGALCKDSPYNCAEAVNPLPAPDTVWMEDMTWMDARDAIAAGKTTAIIPVGGLDPNGP